VLAGLLAVGFVLTLLVRPLKTSGQAVTSTAGTGAAHPLGARTAPGS